LFNENVNAFPFLRCDALKFVMLFRNHLPIEELIQVISAILATLSSSHIILHQYAAVALERILLVRLKNTDKLLFNCDNVVVGPLISSLFNCFSIYPKAQNSHYLMKAVMRCFNIIDNESAKHSNEIIDRMTNMIATAVKTPVDPLHIHYVFESLCILIRRAYLIVDGGIDKYVIPLIENILANDVIEFTPYSLQLTAVLLDEAYEQKKKTGTSLIDSYLPFFNYLMKEDLWNRTANIPAALLVIESFLQCSSENILANHSSMIQAIYQKLMGSKAQDHFGFQLAISLVPKVAVKSNIQVLESIQSGMFKMVIEKVITVELNEMSRILRFEEKRICCIGLINLTVETADYLGEYYAVMVEGLVKIAETSVYDASGIEDQCDEHELIEAYNDRYCKLVYAQHKFTLAVEIQNFKGYLHFS
uniref:Importin-11 n=1 Tax=Dracunculus medinensis TaxID=318479 RepID=A0A0N4UFI5_DRAME